VVILGYSAKTITDHINVAVSYGNVILAIKKQGVGPQFPVIEKKFRPIFGSTSGTFF
jgi:hypothetical protein